MIMPKAIHVEEDILEDELNEGVDNLLWYSSHFFPISHKYLPAYGSLETTHYEKMLWINSVNEKV